MWVQVSGHLYCPGSFYTPAHLPQWNPLEPEFALLYQPFFYREIYTGINSTSPSTCQALLTLKSQVPPLFSLPFATHLFWLSLLHSPHYSSQKTYDPVNPFEKPPWLPSAYRIQPGILGVLPPQALTCVSSCFSSCCSSHGRDTSYSPHTHHNFQAS